MQKLRASRRQRVSNVRDSFKLDDTRNKDLHFLVGPETVSCHQSMLIPYSKFLRSLLRDRISRAGVQDVNIVLADVKVGTVRSLIEYIYTGKTKISRIKEVNEIDSLRRLLHIKIDIDKKIYPVDKSRNTFKSKHDEKSNPKSERIKTEVKSKETIPHEKVRHHSEKKVDLEPAPETSFVTQSQKVSTEKLKEELSTDQKILSDKVIKKENDMNTSNSVPAVETKEENLEKDPYSLNLVQPLKLRVKVETNPEPALFGGSSMFERILKSISGEKEVEGGCQESLQAPEEESDSDSSDSDSSSGDDSDEESDDQEDGDDAIPQLPAESEDGVPSMNTNLLMVELTKDEERLNRAISDFMESPQLHPGACAECGHQLSVDNFVLHHGIHLEDVKQAKLKLLYPPHRREEEEEEHARMEWEEEEGEKIAVKQEPPAQECVAPSPPPSLPPTPPPEKESVEQEIDKLQQDQKRISQGIASFMDKMQRGAKQLECSECQDTVTMINLVSHFQKHILDLHQQIETLMKKKSDNKRKLESVRKETPRKRLKESRPPPAKPKSSVKDEISVSENRERLGSDEERKKMYKRIYGRKKYQYKINRRAEDVTVTEEEIDAEIAKEKAKYSGQPLAGDLGEAANLSPGELLRNYVQFGSKEYKHEFKKARDRLYKRKLRVLRMQGIMDNSAALDIPRADIEVEMLSRYTASRNVKAGDPAPSQEESVESVEAHKNTHEDDLELSLDVDDVGELFKGAETIMGDTSISTLVSEITDEKAMNSILTDIVVKTTLEEEEGVHNQNIVF